MGHLMARRYCQGSPLYSQLRDKTGDRNAVGFIILRPWTTRFDYVYDRALVLDRASPARKMRNDKTRTLPVRGCQLQDQKALVHFFDETAAFFAQINYLNNHGKWEPFNAERYFKKMENGYYRLAVDTPTAFRTRMREQIESKYLESVDSIIQLVKKFDTGSGAYRRLLRILKLALPEEGAASFEMFQARMSSNHNGCSEIMQAL